MIYLILLFIVLLLPSISGLSLRNARGIFLLYFLVSIIIPYGYFVFESKIPSFLSPFIEIYNVEYAILLMIMVFSIVMISSISFKRNKITKVEKLPYSMKGIQVLSLLSFLFFCIYIMLSIIFAGSINDALVAAYSRARVNDSLANFRAVFIWGSVVFTVISSYFLFNGYVKSKKLKYLILLNILLTGLLTLMDGGRAVLLMYILSFFFGSLVNIKITRIIKFSLLFSIIISIISYVMIKVRYETQNAKIADDGKIPLSETINGLAYFDHFLISIQYAKDVGYNFGTVYLNAFMSFIPRDIYPDKAIPLSAEVRNYLYGDSTGGIPPGLFGEAYIAGGLIGLVLISVLYGRILHSTAVLTNKAVVSDCPIRMAIAGIMIPMIGFTLVRGGFDIGVIRVGIPFIWCIFSIKYLSLKK